MATVPSSDVDYREAYLAALLGTVLAVTAALAYVAMRANDGSGGWVVLKDFATAILPNIAVAVLVFPTAHFFLYRRGVLRPHRLSTARPSTGSGLAPRSGGRSRWVVSTVTWDDAVAGIDALVEQINDSEIRYDCIVGLSDGGLIVADLLLFNKKLRVGHDIDLPVIALCPRRAFDEDGKTIKVDPESIPLDHMAAFRNILVVDEASRSGGTMRVVVQALRDRFAEQGLAPRIDVAVLGVLAGASHYPATYHVFELASDDTYPWGPFAEFWRGAR